MAITFGIVAIIAIVFILLYMKENEKCENLKYDNEKLKKDAAQAGIVSAAASRSMEIRTELSSRGCRCS